MRRRLLCVALLCGVALPQGPRPTAPGERRSAPDVLVLVVDDLDLDDLIAIRTPSLDRLAARGVLFRRAYAMPICSPTRYGIVFGEYRGSTCGKSCGLAGASTPDLSLLSLPELLAGNGYATAIFGKWHLGANPSGSWERAPQAHGFDVWRAGSPANVTGCGGSSYRRWRRVDDGVATMSTEYHTLAVRDAFLEWWRTTESPRFGYVAFQAPHVPLHDPPAELLPPGHPPATTPREQYEAMVVAVDTAIGNLLEAVDLASTCVVFLSDNGTPRVAASGPEGIERRGKTTTFEDGIRVPLIVSAPGSAAGRETDALAHAVDVYATVAELAGASVPEGAARDSVSLAPCLTDPSVRVRSFVYSEYDPRVGTRRDGSTPERERAIVTERWKLRSVRHGREQLYDLREDPHETSPIDPDDPSLDDDLERIVADLRARMTETTRRDSR